MTEFRVQTTRGLMIVQAPSVSGARVRAEGDGYQVVTVAEWRGEWVTVWEAGQKRVGKKLVG